MNKRHNKAIERRMVEEALNKGNLGIVAECLSPGFTYHGPGGTEVKGIESYQQFIAGLRTGYPDINITIQDIIAEKDLVATRTLCTFTFTGRAGSPPSAAKKVSMAGSILDRFEGGKIAETWEQYDRLDLYHQLGLIPSGPQHQPQKEHI